MGCKGVANLEGVPNLGPAIVDVNEEEIMYEITFDLPDAVLADNIVPPDELIPDAAPAPALGAPLAATPTKDKPIRNPTQFAGVH